MLAFDGVPIEISGAVLSTVIAVLGPAAGALFPTASVAVAAAIEIVTVPSPVQEESVTVGVAVDPLVTRRLHDAVPVVFIVTLAFNNPTADAPV
jgi:hypothetical protein